MDILDTKENYSEDDSIKSYETYAYHPITGTKLDNPGQIVIRIENQDAFFLPKRSWLQIEGQLVKADGTAYVTGNLITLTNNGLMLLFDNIKYELSEQEIESIYHPGHATTMLGMAKYPNDNLNQCWTLDTSTACADTNLGFKSRREFLIEDADPKGSFRFAIPLDHIFGFCDDYNKVMYGFVHSLTLVRSASSNNAIFRDETEGAGKATEGKITISKVSWMMPKIEPNIEQKNKLYKSILNKDTLSVGFRMRQCTSVSIPVGVKAFTWRLGVRSCPEKPRFMMIAFQTGKAGDQKQNAALFDHCSLTNMYILLNNVRYPAIDFHANFDKNHYDNLYKNLQDFRSTYYGIDSLVSNINVDSTAYKSLFPIFVFDVSKQSERLNQGVVDIIVEMNFGKDIPANTFAYAVLISDRKLKFKSDGTKMNIVY